ncbi:MAG: ribulose-phosphate 3-epimerase [Lachnospiraceae bacterium]|nr:ribulose-phosphate 3-epimerase [Lachnospiraceae bacterium]
MTAKIAPSILSADFMQLGRDIRLAEEAGADLLHFDVMDGKFVPEISYGEPVLRSVRKHTDLFVDVHLMIEEPLLNVESFKKAGADLITFHLEACRDPKRVVTRIRDLGIKCGIAIRPDTPVEALYPFLHDADMFLIMTVYPGFGGQVFMESSLDRIRSLRNRLTEAGLDTDIQTDGGINRETIQRAAEAGANVFVAGSAVFKGDIAANIYELKELVSL